MRRRLSLETLESRLAPASLGTLSFDSQSLTVNFAPVTATTTTTPSAPLPAGTIALPAASANSPVSFNATVGEFTTANGSDSYYLANAVQGSTLNLALGGNGQIGLAVYAQNGTLLAQQSGTGAIGLTLTNLPATGGVTVVVTAAQPTGYLLSTLLSTQSATSPPATSGTTTVSSPLLNGGLGPQLIDPNHVGTSGTINPNPLDTTSQDWVFIGNMRLYDPVGRAAPVWSPPTGFTSPSGLPYTPPIVMTTPPPTTPPPTTPIVMTTP
jgi:hypothetical protein